MRGVNRIKKLIGLNLRAALSILFLVLTFQNCSEVQVADIQTTASMDISDGNDIPREVPPVVDELMKSCEEARTAGRLATLDTEVNFDNGNQVCAWKESGNLSILNGYVRARTENYQSVSVPTDAVVCNIEMDHVANTSFLYDDNVILTLNDYILASTTNFTKHFSSQNGYFKYQWDNLINKPGQVGAADSAPEKQYCAGKNEGLSSCMFPVTQDVGRIDLQIHKTVIQSILAMTNPKNLNLGVITTGDNDSSDCQHTPIRLLLKVEFY